MFKQNCVIEVGDNYLVKHDIYPLLAYKTYKKYEYDINLLKESQFYVNNKKAYIVLEGEKVNIKKMTFPKIKSKKLYKFIIEELSTYYNNSDKIFFNYSIIKDNGNSLDIVVFYSNEGKIKRLERYILANSKIKAVYLIQFCFLQYFNKAIRCKDFIFAFIYKDKIYFLLCINKKVLFNDIIPCSNETKINDVLYEFIQSCRINNGVEVKNIYFANIDKVLISDDTLSEYFVDYLGSINEKTFIKCLRTNRR